MLKKGGEGTGSRGPTGCGGKAGFEGGSDGGQGVEEWKGQEVEDEMHW